MNNTNLTPGNKTVSCLSLLYGVARRVTGTSSTASSTLSTISFVADNKRKKFKNIQMLLFINQPIIKELVLDPMWAGKIFGILCTPIEWEKHKQIDIDILYTLTPKRNRKV